MHTFVVMNMHMLSALNGNVNAHYISHPVLKKLEKTSVIQPRLAWFPPQILGCATYDLNPRQTRQLYLLHLAMGLPESSDQQHQHSIDSWSLQLLRRYLLADSTVSEDEAKGATLEDMRDVWRTVVPRFGEVDEDLDDLCLRFRRDDKPPDTLDANLVPMLAWEYGRVFVHTYRNKVRWDIGVSLRTRQKDELWRAMPSTPP
jgi:hypothetical protein